MPLPPLRMPASTPALNAVLFLGASGYLAYLAIPAVGNERLLGWIFAALALSTSVGYFFQTRWARWGAIAFCLLAAAWRVPILLNDDAPIQGSLLAVFCLVACYWFWKEAITPEEIAREEASANEDEEEQAEQAEDRSMTSLVLLLREPRYLDLAILAHAASQAWDVEMLAGEQDDDAESFVVGDSPMFVVKHVDRVYVVHNHAQPYFDEPQEVAEQMNELRRRKAILEHQCWMSVDAMLVDEDADDADRREAYAQIGRLVAVLAADDTLAVFSPASGQIVPYDAELDQVLRSGDPREVFESPSNPPVLEIAPDDPRMQAAVAEARERWPEFVSAFENRKEDERFSVKAPFRDDKALEFMWVDVTAIEGDLVLGTLGNEPVNVTGLVLGGRVRVSISELNDWIVVRDERLHGGFTVKALERIQREEG